MGLKSSGGLSSRKPLKGAQPACGHLTLLSQLQCNWQASVPSEVLQKGERVESTALEKEFCMWQPESAPISSDLQVLHFTVDLSDNMVLAQRRRTNGGKSLKMMAKGERLLLLKSCHVRKKD